MSRALSRIALVLSLLLTAVWWTAGQVPPVRADTITDCPTSEADLTTAITNAGSAGTVQLSCNATITLSSTITLSLEVTIDGNGHAVAISAGTV